MQDQLNDNEKSDISSIDILLHYWKSRNGKLAVKVNGLHGLGDDTIEAADINIDYLETITLYTMGTSIWVKTPRKF